MCDDDTVVKLIRNPGELDIFIDFLPSSTKGIRESNSNSNSLKNKVFMYSL